MIRSSAGMGRHDDLESHSHLKKQIDKHVKEYNFRTEQAIARTVPEGDLMKLQSPLVSFYYIKKETDVSFGLSISGEMMSCYSFSFPFNSMDWLTEISFN